MIGRDLDTWHYVSYDYKDWGKFKNNNYDGVVVPQAFMYGPDLKKEIYDTFLECAWNNREFVYLIIR